VCCLLDRLIACYRRNRKEVDGRMTGGKQDSYGVVVAGIAI
jgi:hypothetical protein